MSSRDTVLPTVTSMGEDAPRFTRQAAGAVLLVTEGVDAGRMIRVGSEQAILGSGEDCDGVIADKTVSRRHARASWNGNAVDLEDLESKNGIVVAGRRHDAATLRPGDCFRLGHAEIKILPAETAVQPVAADESSFGSLVGASTPMRELYSMIEEVAGADSPVVIEGETGVGKELVAEEIHRRSARSTRRFSILDCACIPEHLVESTMFGHVKGAFTGADEGRTGIFLDSDGGTVFLDEIGELPLQLQPALLRVLDRGMVRRVGATSYETVDVRVVAATHRSLGAEVRAGRFREDLYYRLAVVRLYVPPLRERQEDVPLLIRSFLERLHYPHLSPAPEDLRALAQRDWPGNVRELRNVVERAVIRARKTGRLDLRAESLDDATPKARESAARAPSLIGKSFRQAKQDAVRSFERAYLEELLAAHPSLRKAADAAGMDRKHLRTLLGRHGLLDS